MKQHALLQSYCEQSKSLHEQCCFGDFYKRFENKLH